jgi:lysophospholipase L1-like esterase
MLVRLQLRDLFQFSWSYPEYWQKWVAFRGILLKGFTYHTDFQQLLLHPRKRFADVRDANKHWGEWADGYTGAEQNLDGLHIDWMRRTASYPDRIGADQRKLIESVLLEELPPDQGITTSYFRFWYARILDHYRGSATKIIFLRLPRAPVPAPEHAPKLNSAVRQLASQPNVVILSEHLFDPLERPELFMDAIHLNREGMVRFSRMLAAEVPRVLGPPRY